MAILKYLNRLELINRKIKSKSTGKPADFSSLIGYSKSMLYEDLKDLREMGAEIGYSRYRNSFYYMNNFNLKISIDKFD